MHKNKRSYIAIKEVIICRKTAFQLPVYLPINSKIGKAKTICKTETASIAANETALQQEHTGASDRQGVLL